ncbi:MAG: hypothetical protein ACFE0K_01735 [Alcanivorax sp.]|uniref:hypothetical protein n=1 Tax=Alcanivorax sp. TaxID=1872427 RepID=UPI003DA74EC3
MNLNKVSEIHDGVFESILDFPDQKALIDLLVEPRLPLVLMVEVSIGNSTWQQVEISGINHLEGFAREVSGDFIVTTDEFLRLSQEVRWIWAVQMERTPPDYFDFTKIKGAQRYKILKSCGFRFVLESQPGGGDYATVVTQSEELSRRAIDETTV